MYETLLKTIEERDITKYRLAKLSNVPLSDLYAIFKGKRSLFPSWRVRICEALEMDDRELFPELPPIKGKVRPRGGVPKTIEMEQLEERVAMLESKVEELERRIK